MQTGLRVSRFVPACLAPVVFAAGWACGVASDQPALDDPGHLVRTREAASASKAIYYETCEELGLSYVRSQAAFVLIEVGDAAAVAGGLAERGILVINAEASWGLKGMIRVSYGNEQESRIFAGTLKDILR